MAFISIALIGILISCILTILISIIVILFSLIVALVAVLLSSLIKKNHKNYLLGIKVFILTGSGVIGAGFGFLVVYFLVSLNVITLNEHFPVYSIAFSIIGFIAGLLFALLVNKKIIEPVYAFLKKIRRNLFNKTWHKTNKNDEL